MMYKIVHNLVDVDRNALITFNSTSVVRNSFLKLYKQTSLSSVRAQFLCMRGIICQRRQDLQHLSMLLKMSAYLQLNQIVYPFNNRFINTGHTSVFSL